MIFCHPDEIRATTISLGPESGIYASDFALSSYALTGRFDRRGRINTIFRILSCLSTFPEESLKTKSLRYKYGDRDTDGHTQTEMLRCDGFVNLVY